MYQHINIHSHRIRPDEQSIFNLDMREKPLLLQNQRYSAGFHPWFLARAPEAKTALEQLKSLLFRHKNIVAIGECGLDRQIDVPLSRQIEFFVAQLKLAVSQHYPVIIHSVKSNYEILKLKKHHAPHIAFVMHNFTGSEQEAFALIEQGCYLSFGKSLFEKKRRTNRYLEKIPLNRIFLETDETEIPIQRIYNQFINLRKESSLDIVNTIYQNYKTLFE